MCCEDVRINWHKRSTFKAITLTGGVQQEILGVSPDRWSILMQTNVAGAVYITPDNSAANAVGMTVLNTQPAFYIDREMIGDLIGKSWFAFRNTTVVLYVVETFLFPGGPCTEDHYGKRDNIIAGATGSQPPGAAAAKRLVTSAYPG